MSNYTCPDIISSSCIRWQGDSYEDLQICLDSALTGVITVVINKIRDVLKGKGILLPDLNLDDCEYIKDLLGNKEKDLLNMLDVYKTAICEIKEAVNANSQSLDSFTDTSKYTLGVISPTDPCGAPLTFHELVQNIVTKLNELNESFSNLANDLSDAMKDAVGDVLVSGAVTSAGENGISYTGEGSAGKVILTALVPPYCPIVFTGSVTNFDITGKGIDSTPYRGWYRCNGNNGTPNATSLPQNSASNLEYIIRFD